MSTKPVDVDALRGHTPGPWRVDFTTREAVVDAPCGRILYCVSSALDDHVDADARLIAAAPALLAEVIERRARDAKVAQLVESAELMRANFRCVLSVNCKADVEFIDKQTEAFDAALAALRGEP